MGNDVYSSNRTMAPGDSSQRIDPGVDSDVSAFEGGHLLGLGVSAGTIAISDLRMMGLIFKKESASDVFHQLIPWTSARDSR